jgi:hypothetical protein
MMIGNFMLVAGLIFWIFVRPAHAARHDWLDALCGLLLGVSTGVNLLAVRRVRPCRSTQTTHS